MITTKPHLVACIRWLGVAMGLHSASATTARSKALTSTGWLLLVRLETMASTATSAGGGHPRINALGRTLALITSAKAALLAPNVKTVATCATGDTNGGNNA